jgi:ATP-dependent helicase HepA
MTGSIKPGQRWVSNMEPELGLGTVVEADARTVLMRFPAAACERRFALASAPLSRVRFRPGDHVQARDGGSFSVERVEERDGSFVYFGGGRELPEQDLSDALSFTTPVDRLLGGFLDSNAAFDLRQKILDHYSTLLKSPVRGFLGARIDLIPHQIYVSGETSRHPFPRVLLSDEAGLGKTIEACLILHRLLLTGRVTRALILLPETLVHQWFVELLRKFNLVFRIFNEEHCASIEQSEPGANPFLKDQLCLCSLSFLLRNEKRARQADEAGWDMLVVDEAHHLVEATPAYELVRTLGGRSPGLMLLTATPEQLGRRSHFARLRLLDPNRYHDFKTFEAGEKEYAKTARLVESLLEKKIPDIDKRPKTSGSQADDEDPSNARLIEEILDRRGVGRVVFRNTRAVMAGFPAREAHLVALPASGDDIKTAEAEFRADMDGANEDVPYDFTRDPRMAWLTRFLEEIKGEKALLICRSVEKVRAIDDALHGKIKTCTALFHEELSLMQRDKNAAWFARKDGAQVLLCSEIGSEGRNFQFARNLVLFDLPFDPEILEQRIGRLDRIGQKQVVRIYAPFTRGSPQQTLARWYHEGLNAFRKNVPGAWHIHQKLGKRMIGFAQSRRDPQAFIEETRRECVKTARLLEAGRDRLLELHSFNFDRAERWTRAIQNMDQDKKLEPFVEALLDAFGIRIEDAPGRIRRIFFDSLSDPAFPLPLLRDESLSATFDRETAVRREDVEFLSWDHPMVTGAMDLILGSEKGNAAAALWPKADTEEMLLEAVFILECVAPPKLHAHRFLPPSPIRVVVNHRFENRTDACRPNVLAAHLRGVPPVSLMQNAGVKALIPKMSARCEELAMKSAEGVISAGLQEMETVLQNEINRLRELNDHAPIGAGWLKSRIVDTASRCASYPSMSSVDAEILHYIDEKSSLREAIRSARPRLDALRLVICISSANDGVSMGI